MKPHHDHRSPVGSLARSRYSSRGQVRHRFVVTTGGVVLVEVRDRLTNQLIDLHWEALIAYFHGVGTADLVEFAGTEVDGLLLLSDPAMIRLWQAPGLDGGL